HRDVLALQLERAPRAGLDERALLLLRVLDVVHDMRAEHDPVVRERRDRGGELERRVRVVALADADADRLARVPFLLEAAHLPFLRREYADRLPRDVDAGAAAEAEHAHEA